MTGAAAGNPIRVLFVGTSNATRSILAEGVLRRAGGHRFAVASAGVAPTEVHPLTRRVLAEVGIDSSWAEATSIDAFAGRPFDYVITVCDDARAVCPVFPGADQSLHWGYGDPARVVSDDATRLAAFERVFSDLAGRVRQFVVIAERHSRLATA
jgi:protein-tyrosine-phosphatase